MNSSRKLDSAEKWLRDGIGICQAPAYFECVEADMSRAQSALARARAAGTRITYGHILVRAAALALAANPDLNSMVCGGKAYNPHQVDIALSVSGDSIAAPLLVIEAAERKLLPALAAEISRRAPEIRDADKQMLEALRRWGWMLPFGLLRRALLRFLFTSYNFRRKGAGTFQVSVLPEVERAMSPVFSSSAMLVAGGVMDKVVAVDGRVSIKPMITLTCCADHRVWDGRAGQRLLISVKAVLESESIYQELSECVDSKRVMSANVGQ